MRLLSPGHKAWVAEGLNFHFYSVPINFHQTADNWVMGKPKHAWNHLGVRICSLNCKADKIQVEIKYFHGRFSAWMEGRHQCEKHTRFQRCL